VPYGTKGLLKAPGSPGINGVKSCILAISWQQKWPFRNYNLIQKITNFQNIFLKQNEQRTQYFRDYEKSKRSRQFLKEWKQNRPRLVDTESETGMIC
jgi:hypothetical protein